MGWCRPSSAPTSSAAPGAAIARYPPPREGPSFPLPLGRDFFERSPVRLARDLLGCQLLRLEEGRLSGGLIVETEAYDGPADLASHARFGRTSRNRAMFGPGGHAYVYLVYGMHTCLNVVSGPPGVPGAVLIRALAPCIGEEAMRLRRGRPHEGVARLAAGPGRLAQALAIDRSLDGLDLTAAGPLWLAAPPRGTIRALRRAGVVLGPRVGVHYAGSDWGLRPWRMGWRGHPSLSRPFPPADPMRKTAAGA